MSLNLGKNLILVLQNYEIMHGITDNPNSNISLVDRYYYLRGDWITISHKYEMDEVFLKNTKIN